MKLPIRFINLSIVLCLFAEIAFCETIIVSSGTTLTVHSNTTLTVTGGIQIDSSSGAIDNSGNIQLTGDWTNNGNGLINASPGKVVLNGSAIQTIGGNSSTTFNKLTVNNSSDVNITNHETVSDTLTFSSGNIKTDTNNLIMSVTGTIIGGGTGWVVGNLQWGFDASHLSHSFVLGDTTNYTPVLITFNSVSSAGDLTGRLTASEHAQISSSPVSAASDVNRFWTFTNNGITFGSASAIFNWVAADVDAGADTNKFSVGKYDSPNWTSLSVINKMATSIEATGITSFSDFVIGEGGEMTFNASLFLQGFYLGNGTMSPLLKLLNTPGATWADVDTITVELHNASSPYDMEYTSRGVLKKDGSLTCSFPGAASGNYYVVIKHRTILETWSATAVSISNPYNFSSSASQAYGNKQADLGDGKFALYSGDVSTDGSTEGQDGSIDNMDKREIELILPGFQHIYGANDVTGDGLVDLTDYMILRNNIGVSASRP